MTTLIPTRNLYNRGLCFTKGKEYTIDKTITEKYMLINVELTNDMGEPHIIGGTWYKFFKIINK